MPSINLIKTSDGTGNAAVATVQSSRSPLATTIIVDTVNNFPSTFMGSMGTPHTFVDPITAEEITVISDATAVDFTGHVDGTNLEIDSIAPGYTDLGSSAGDIIVIRPTSEYGNNIASVLAVSHNDDGMIKTGILTASNSTAGANIETWRSEDVFDHIASGCVWSGDAYGSTRVASCTSGVVYLSGKRLTVAAVTSRSFTASKDVYCDLHDNGDGTAVWVYTDNTTNAASPALTAGNLRGAIIVVGASNIASAASLS